MIDQDRELELMNEPWAKQGRSLWYSAPHHTPFLVLSPVMARLKRLTDCTNLLVVGAICNNHGWCCGLARRFTSTGEVALATAHAMHVSVFKMAWRMLLSVTGVGHSWPSDLDVDFLTLNHVWCWVVCCHAVVHKCGVSVPQLFPDLIF